MLFRTIACTLTAAALAVPAFPQQGESPTSTGETGLFTLVDAVGLEAGNWAFGLHYDNWDRLVAPVPGRPPGPGESDDWDYDHHRVALNLAYAFADGFEVALSVPWERFDADDHRHFGIVNGKTFEESIDADGLSNVRLGTKYRFWGDESAALAARAFVELPTGDDEDGLVTGDTGWGVGLAWTISPAFVANLDYRDPGNADDFDVAEEIGAGIGHVAELSDRLDWITELDATFYQGGDSRPDDVYDLASGGRWRFGDDHRWALDFGLRLELGQLSDMDDHCPIGGLLGVSFSPSRRRAMAPAAPVAPPPPGSSPASPPGAGAPGGVPGAPGSGPGATAPAVPAAPPVDATAPPARTPSAPTTPAAPPTPKELRETVNFDSGSARLSNIAKAKLDEVALRLRQDPRATATIVGHADTTGDAAANEELSRQRAEAAREYLVSRHGIEAARVRVEARGESAPAADESSASGKAENRRAEIVVRIGG
jgi:outer membrane protein OmpA-like peptidoglycan-associated protein